MDVATRNRWLARGGYTLLAFTSFFYFLYLGFPFERVLPRVLESYKKELGGMKIEADSIRAGWFGSLVAREVKIYASGKRGGEDESPTVKLDRVKVGFKPLKLLTGKIGVKLDSQLYGGNVHGTVLSGGSSTSVDLVVNGVEIAKYPVSVLGAPVALSGQVGGTVKLAVDAEDGTKTTGKIDLSIKNPRIEESNLILVKIPTTVFDRGGAAVIDIKDGKVELVDVGIRGEDLDMGVEGHIALKKRLGSSTWSAASIIRASEAWKSKVPGFENIVGAGKCGDGSYKYKIAGVLGGIPRTVPDRGCR